MSAAPESATAPATAVAAGAAAERAESRKPVILAVDDDPQVLRAVRRDLRSAYGDRYRVLGASSAADALKILDSSTSAATIRRCSSWTSACPT